MSEELTQIEVVVFEDEDGTEIEMQIVDEFDHNGRHYVVLIPSPEEGAEIDVDGEDDLNLFEVTKDEKGEEDFNLVEDKKLLAELAGVVEDRLLAR